MSVLIKHTRVHQIEHQRLILNLHVYASCTVAPYVQSLYDTMRNQMTCISGQPVALRKQTWLVLCEKWFTHNATGGPVLIISSARFHLQKTNMNPWGQQPPFNKCANTYTNKHSSGLKTGGGGVGTWCQYELDRKLIDMWSMCEGAPVRSGWAEVII